jgi:hypothetical protein
VAGFVKLAIGCQVVCSVLGPADMGPLQEHRQDLWGAPAIGVIFVTYLPSFEGRWDLISLPLLTGLASGYC